MKTETKVRKIKSPKAKITKDSAETTPTKTAYPPYNEQAAKYMYEKVPGAYSRILYIGEQVSKEIAEILGRSITLPEAEHLVSLDGEIAVCAASDPNNPVKFQPIKYLPFVPKGLREKIRSGIPLVDMRLPLGGAYYLKKDGTVIAYSGSVFRYNLRQQRYEWADTSPLVMAADLIGKRYGHRQWGVPFSEVANILKARAAAAERRQRIENMVENIAPRHPLVRMGDAFENAKHEDNGKPKCGYNRARTRLEENVIAGQQAEEE
jgi:hypothetical protein